MYPHFHVMSCHFSHGWQTQLDCSTFLHPICNCSPRWRVPQKFSLGRHSLCTETRGWHQEYHYHPLPNIWKEKKRIRRTSGLGGLGRSWRLICWAITLHRQYLLLRNKWIKWSWKPSETYWNYLKLMKDIERLQILLSVMIKHDGTIKCQVSTSRIA